MSSPSVSPSSNPLPKWQSEHKIKKHTYNPLRDPCLGMKIGFIAFSILLIPFAPILALVKLGLYLREKHIAKSYPKHPLNSIREMKGTEERDKFETMQKVLEGCKSADLHSSAKLQTFWLEQLRHKLKNFDPRQKMVHYLTRELNKEGLLGEENIKHLPMILNAPETLNSLDEIERVVRGRLPDVTDDIWNRVKAKVNAKLIEEKEQEAKLDKFKTALQHLIKTLERDPASKDFDATAANREFIGAFREVLNTHLYRQFKEDSSLEAIHFLHRLAVDTWNNAPSMDAYMKVGQNIVEQTGIALQPGEELTGAVVSEKLKKSHDKMAKLHYPAKGLVPMFNYAVSHIQQTIGGLASEGMVPGMLYDSHGTLSNNPSLQGVTKIEYAGEEATVHNCYGGSPTIGNHKIAPEFRAMLQAAENNQFLKDDKRDPKIPCIVNYHNFQNLDNTHGEGERSRLIMLLQLRYPLSFRGMTLAKDSKLYQMHHDSDVIWTSAQQFQQEMLNQMNRSFNPNEKGHGFYFPGSKEQWQPVFDAILDQVTTHFSYLEVQIKNSKGDAALQDIKTRRTLQGAYQEFVYAMIKAHSEVESVNILNKRNIKESILVVLINACKENIDRGGMANTLYLYQRVMGEDTLTAKDKLALLVGAMHCRAISARDRLILSSRMPQGLDFIAKTEASEFKTRRDAAFKKLGHQVEKNQYSPHLPRRAVAGAA